MSLVIKPIPKKDPDDLGIRSFLPQLPFRMVVVAPSESGKTTMIYNMLTRQSFKYKTVFKNNIFPFSPSIGYDDALDDMGIKEENRRNELDETFVNAIIDEQKTLIDEHGKAHVPHILMLFDDVVLQIRNTKDNALKRIFFYGRKYKISCIITTQKYKALAPDYRLNASNYIYFLNVSEKEKYSIVDDQPTDKKIFEQIWKRAQDQGTYAFIYVNMKQNVKDRYYINFTEHITIKK